MNRSGIERTFIVWPCTDQEERLEMSRAREKKDISVDHKQIRRREDIQSRPRTDQKERGHTV